MDVHLKNGNKKEAEKICHEFIEDSEVHPYFKMHAYTILSTLGEQGLLSSGSEKHVENAKILCDQLYENEQPYPGALLKHKEMLDVSLNVLRLLRGCKE